MMRFPIFNLLRWKNFKWSIFSILKTQFWYPWKAKKNRKVFFLFSCGLLWHHRTSDAHKGGAKGAMVPLMVEKIKSFVTFTPNLISKSLKTHHFLNETLQFDFLGLKNTIFFKILPQEISGCAYGTGIV